MINNKDKTIVKLLNKAKTKTPNAERRISKINHFLPCLSSSLAKKESKRPTGIAKHNINKLNKSFNIKSIKNTNIKI